MWQYHFPFRYHHTYHILWKQLFLQVGISFSQTSQMHPQNSHANYLQTTGMYWYVCVSKLIGKVKHKVKWMKNTINGCSLWIMLPVDVTFLLETISTARIIDHVLIKKNMEYGNKQSTSYVYDKMPCFGLIFNRHARKISIWILNFHWQPIEILVLMIKIFTENVTKFKIII